MKTDRFYIIKDPNGNYYKLKFISFHPSEGGTRGRPIIDYKLVKKA
ncbi:MAG: HmuY family protein [Runella zeae]